MIDFAQKLFSDLPSQLLVQILVTLIGMVGAFYLGKFKHWMETRRLFKPGVFPTIDRIVRIEREITGGRMGSERKLLVATWYAKLMNKSLEEALEEVQLLFNLLVLSKTDDFVPEK